jgi:thiamine kinase-like enzyme
LQALKQVFDQAARLENFIEHEQQNWYTNFWKKTTNTPTSQASISKTAVRLCALHSSKMSLAEG